MNTYQFFADPGHGWLRVPHTEIVGLGIVDDITPYSYMDDEHAYLEEDCDLSLFLSTVGPDNVHMLEEHTDGDDDSFVRRLRRFDAAASRSLATRAGCAA